MLFFLELSLLSLSVYGRRRYHSGQRYIFVNEPKTYEQAKEYCASLGSGKCPRSNGLATIRDGFEELKLNNGIRRTRCRRVWIKKNYLGYGLSADEYKELNNDELIDNDNNNDNNNNIGKEILYKPPKKKCAYVEKFCGKTGRAKCRRKTCFVCDNPDYGGDYDSSYVWGDPHFSSCWARTARRVHHFQGTSGCTYLLVTPCKIGNYKKVPFEIAGEFKAWAGRATVVRNVYIKLYNTKKNEKELTINLDNLLISNYAEVNDGVTPNYFDDGKSYYLAKITGNTRSFEIFVNYKKKIFCQYDLKIQATKVVGVRGIYWNIRVYIDRQKYLNKICGLFGYFQTDRNLFYVSRDNLAVPIRNLHQWGQTYLDSDSDVQSSAPKCKPPAYNYNELNMNMDEVDIKSDAKTDGSAIIKLCQSDKNIKKLCKNKFESECKPLEEDGKCDLGSELSKNQFDDSCTFDVCNKCFKEFKNGLLGSMKDLEKYGCGKGEATAACKDYCEQEQIHFGKNPKNEEDEDQFMDDNDFNQFVEDENDESNYNVNDMVMDNSNYVNNYNLFNIIFYALISITIIFSICYIIYKKREEKNDSLLHIYDME